MTEQTRLIRVHLTSRDNKNRPRKTIIRSRQATNSQQLTDGDWRTRRIGCFQDLRVEVIRGEEIGLHGRDVAARNVPGPVASSR